MCRGFLFRLVCCTPSLFGRAVIWTGRKKDGVRRNLARSIMVGYGGVRLSKIRRKFEIPSSRIDSDARARSSLRPYSNVPWPRGAGPQTQNITISYWIKVKGPKLIVPPIEISRPRPWLILRRKFSRLGKRTTGDALDKQIESNVRVRYARRLKRFCRRFRVTQYPAFTTNTVRFGPITRFRFFEMTLYRHCLHTFMW